MRSCVVLVVLAVLAHADTTTPAPSSARAQRCDVYQSHYWSSFRSERETPSLARRFPGLDLKQVTARHALFTQAGHAVDSVAPEALVVELPSLRPVTRLRVFADSFVEDSRGELVPLLGLHDQVTLLDPITGQVRWRRALSLRGDSAAALADGDHLYLALFHRIATGSQLLSLRLSDGKSQWSAAVEQLNVDHSKYANDVELTLEGDTLLMVGREAGGCYWQRFNSDGKRLSSRILK